MKFIEWCGLLQIGHPVIDEQHQTLFKIINQFHQDLEDNKTGKTAVNTLNKLISFAQKHFTDEEKISSDFGFPDENLVEHKKIHEQLVMDIFELHTAVSKASEVDLEEIRTFLTNWIILHVLIEDNKYKAYIFKK
jgi:hemerythrin